MGKRFSVWVEARIRMMMIVDADTKQGAEAIVDTMMDNASPADLREAVCWDVRESERYGDAEEY